MKKVFQNPQGEKIDHSFTSATNPKHSDWLVILVHGVTGNKDRPIVKNCADALNEAGFDTLRFSFSGNGESDGDFRQATISKEIHDLRAVLDAVSKDYDKICCLGHSMGSAVSLLVTADDSRVNAFISLAGMVDTKKFAQTEFGDETPDAGNMWDDPDCPLSSEYMDDLCQKIVSVLPQAEKTTVPWLLMHGTSDDTVSPNDSDSVEALEMKNVGLVRVDGADHSFSDPEHTSIVAKTITDWLSEVARS